MVVESRSVIRNAKNARGLGRDAPFPKSCASYFRFARFNTFPLYYLRAWHRLGIMKHPTQKAFCFPKQLLDETENDTKNSDGKVIIHFTMAKSSLTLTTYRQTPILTTFVMSSHTCIFTNELT